jgi:hypothetical protein
LTMTLYMLSKSGLELYQRYFDEIKKNDIYFISSILDPRIKTRWLIKNFPSANQIILRIKTFLKSVYKVEPELPKHKDAEVNKSLEYKFLEEFESSYDEVIENDIDWYFDTPLIKFILDSKEDQTEWTLKW